MQLFFLFFSKVIGIHLGKKGNWVRVYVRAMFPFQYLEREMSVNNILIFLLNIVPFVIKG